MPDLGATDLILGFLLLITPVVFIHELGHYWVARKAGVVVDVFSVGFGPEIYGWTAKTGTRWRIAAIPLGGYVKMRGDDDVASTQHHMCPRILEALLVPGCIGGWRLWQLGLQLILFWELRYLQWFTCRSASK